MAQSIGELFVKLGFDVDDAKLKEFSNNVNDVYSGLTKFATVIGGAAGITYGLKEMAHHASQTAVSLRDLKSELGIDSQSAGRFAAQFTHVNPNSTLEQGYGVLASLAQYRVQMLQGGSQEYGFFGGSLAQRDPVAMLEQLRRGYGLAMAQANGNTALVTKWLTDITGSPAIANWIKAQQQELDNASQLFDLNQKQQDSIVKQAQAVRDLDTAWGNFYTKILGNLAAPFTNLMNTITYKGWSHFFDGWGGSNSNLGEFLNKQDLRGKAARIIGWNASPEALDAYIAAHPELSGGSTTHAGGAVGLRNNNPGNLQPGGIEASFGSPEVGLAAMAMQLRRYGMHGWNTIDSIVNHWAPGNAPGNSPATAAGYKMALMRALGIGANTPMNLSDTSTIASLMAPMIRQEQGRNPFSAGQLEAAARNVTNNVTINVVTNADAAETAEKVNQKLHEITYPQVNLSTGF